MTGFMNGYALFGDEKYLSAFAGTWEFINEHFMDHTLGESRQLLTRSGEAIIAHLGNAWKGMYHTGRALAECIKRIDRIQNKA